MKNIHHSSIAEKGAAIGKGTCIAEKCYIGSNVAIGENNTIASGVVISGNTTIGDNNIIAEDSVLGTAPQDPKPTSNSISLNIGDNNTIGKSVLINAGTDNGGGVTSVGSNNRIMDNAHIGHDVQMGNYCTMNKNSTLGGHVMLEDGVYFGESSAVHQFVKIGELSYIKKNSALSQDIPPYCLVEGNRAKIVGLNKELLNKSLSSKQVDDISSAYAILFTHNKSPKESAIDELPKSNSKEVKKIYKFIIGSNRGIPFKRKINVD